MDAIVGRRVHMMMWDRKESQSRLGRVIGQSQNSISKKLRGERGWSLDELVRVADHYGVSPADLLAPPGPADGPPAPGGGKLPGVDSNHQPCGYPARRRHLRLAS